MSGQMTDPSHGDQLTRGCLKHHGYQQNHGITATQVSLPVGGQGVGEPTG